VLKGRHIPDPFKPKREPSYWHDWIVGMPGFLLVGVLNAAAIVVILVLIHHFHKTSWATAVVWRGFNWNRRSPVIYWHFFNIASFIPLLGWIAAIEGYGWHSWRAQHFWLALCVLGLIGQVVVLCSLL
jgi:hypothetical protein